MYLYTFCALQEITGQELPISDPVVLNPFHTTAPRRAILASPAPRETVPPLCYSDTPVLAGIHGARYYLASLLALHVGNTPGLLQVPTVSPEDRYLDIYPAVWCKDIPSTQMNATTNSSSSSSSSIPNIRVTNLHSLAHLVCDLSISIDPHYVPLSNPFASPTQFAAMRPMVLSPDQLVYLMSGNNLNTLQYLTWPLQDTNNVPLKNVSVASPSHAKEDVFYHNFLRVFDLPSETLTELLQEQSRLFREHLRKEQALHEMIYSALNQTIDARMYEDEVLTIRIAEGA